MPEAGPAARRARIESIFEAAAELEAEERRAYISAACANDPSLRSEVEALLAAHERAAGVLDARAADLVDELKDLPQTERIGPYTVIRRIGHGGMGSVYLAERDDGQFRRRVAIKVLRSGADDLLLYRRFLAERQILATLDHPNIARLYDGGVTENGLPYLVMEYVEGLTITDYCDRQKLSLEERVRLFCAVCEAVHYAHQNLVIHRDLKPTNILVSANGQVKLLDFGIAKLLGPAVVNVGAPVTHTDQRLMTPEYASPEQLRGDPLTTASDVYALGVVLYELLCGVHPYDMTRRSPEEVVRAVLERDPERPSTRVQRDASSSAEVERATSMAETAAARGVTPDRLQRRLRGDLDAITMVALRKEPNRRYPSADLLKEDLRRYLEGEFVTAHRGGRGYRMLRLIKRYRMEAAALAVVVLSLFAGAGVSLWQASRARLERDRANTALADAEAALGETRAVSDFLFQLFQASAPGEVGGDTIQARELLRRGVERADRLESTPAVQAKMLDVVGRIHERLGSFAEAKRLLERAVTIRENVFGSHSAEAAESMANLAFVLRRTGEYSRSVELWERSLAIRRDLYGETDTIVPTTMVGLAGMYIYRGRLDESERTYSEALRIMEKIVGPNHPSLINILVPYGGLLRTRAKGEQSEVMFRRAIAVLRDAYGPEHPDLALPMFNLAELVWDNRADSAEALRLQREGLELARRTLGEMNPTFAGYMNWFADALTRYGHLQEADSAYRLTLSLDEQIWGPRAAGIGPVLSSYSIALRQMGRMEDAERVADEAVARTRESWGANHTIYAGVLADRAWLHMARGNAHAAEDLLRDAVRIRRAASGDTPIVGITLADLGIALGERGDFAGADSMTAEALRILRASYPEYHGDIRRVHGQAARYYEKWGIAAKAEEHRAAARAAEAAQPRAER